MKTMNLNELREQVADAHRKLLLKASKEELEDAKREIRDELGLEIDKLKM